MHTLTYTPGVALFFPDCEFEVRFDGGALRLGRKNEGAFVLKLPEPVPRAERLEAVFVTLASATSGSGNNRRVTYHTLFQAPLGFRFTKPGLDAGTHAIRFALELPESLGQAYLGEDCRIEHRVDLRLDVDWAVDPTARVDLFPVRPPLAATPSEPAAFLTPSSLHPRICVELRLESRVVAQGEALRGVVALRAGHDESFARIELALFHCATITMRGGEKRLTELTRIDIPAASLKEGTAYRFELPTNGLPYDQRTGALDLSSVLRIELDPGPLSSNRHVDHAIVVLPRGTRVEGDAAPAAVGAARLRQIASTLASEIGWSASEGNVLVHGREGPVTVTVEDATRGPELAALVAVSLPDPGLGLRIRPEGLLVRATEETPSTLSPRFVVRAEPESPFVPLSAVRAFLEQACVGLEQARDVELSDHRLAYRVLLAEDGVRSWRRIVSLAHEQARAVVEATKALPFGGEPAHLAAWRAAEREEEAFLVASRPALVGVARTVRTLAGELRRFEAVLSVAWTASGPSTRLDVRVHDVELPVDAKLEGEGMRALREIFPDVSVTSAASLAATRKGIPADPRTLLPALDAAVRWFLEARGERRVDAPYR